MKIKLLISEFLEHQFLLQVATSVDNIPWVCTVCFGSDSRFNLYWFSRRNARHSKEIAINPIVAGTVAPPYVLGDKSRGLQLVGKATEIQTEEDIVPGLDALRKRYGVHNKRIDQLRHELLAENRDYGLYRLQPQQIILYDTLNFPDAPRQVLHVMNTTAGKYTAQPLFGGRQ